MEESRPEAPRALDGGDGLPVESGLLEGPIAAEPDLLPRYM